MEGQEKDVLSKDINEYYYVTIPNREEAIRVRDTLHKKIEQYGFASVADLLKSVYGDSNDIDKEWGWTNTNDIALRRTVNGYAIHCGPLVHLTEKERYMAEQEKGAKIEFVWKNFERLFPMLAMHVDSWERAGSKMISIEMDDGVVLWFLYYSPTNWNLGTKPWRMKPREGDELLQDGLSSAT